MKADIDITRTHDLGLEKAQQVVESFSKKMAENGIDHQWQDANKKMMILVGKGGHVKGCQGFLSLTPTTVQLVVANLPFLAKAFKGTIEKQINDHFDSYINQLKKV